MGFFVGQKVTLVLDIINRGREENRPRKGEVYTVRTVEWANDVGSEAIRLVEIVNIPRQYNNAFGELRFISKCFRPVVEKKTDISIFTAMLTPHKNKTVKVKAL
jgi:hypothetical protein